MVTCSVFSFASRWRRRSEHAMERTIRDSVLQAPSQPGSPPSSGPRRAHSCTRRSSSSFDVSRPLKRPWHQDGSTLISVCCLVPLHMDQRLS